MNDCLLQPPVFGEILRRCEAALAAPEFSRITPYDEQSGRGVLRHLYLRRGYHSGEIMVCFVTAADRQPVRALLRKLGELLMQEIPEIRSVMLNVNETQTRFAACRCH